MSDRASGRGFAATLTWSLVALQLLVVAGTVGYMTIEGWRLLDALFMAVITLTTIGFGEVHPLSDAGRLFTIGYIITGLGLATRGVSDVARYLAEGRFAEDVRIRRARRELAAMQKHYVVIGFGRLGREIVANLMHHGGDVVVVDLEARDGLPPGVRLIVGDATHDETLEQAGITRAAGLAVATPSDAVNVYITLSARQLNPALFIQTRVEEESAAVKARRAGANGVLLPYHLGGTRMASALLRPGTSAFIEHATARHFDDLHLEDVQLGENTTISGSLGDLRLRNRFGVIVLAVQRVGEERLLTAEADTRVGPGDTLIVVGEPGKVKAFVTQAHP